MAVGKLSPEDFSADVAAACSRFGIGGPTGDRLTRVLRAILEINRTKRAAHVGEISKAADVPRPAVSHVLLDAVADGRVVRVRAGLYVVTEKGERSLS